MYEQNVRANLKKKTHIKNICRDVLILHSLISMIMPNESSYRIVKYYYDVFQTKLEDVPCNTSHILHKCFILHLNKKGALKGVLFITACPSVLICYFRCSNTGCPWSKCDESVVGY